MEKNRLARDITVEGIVQGVGFRPFVFQLARRRALCGEVANTAAGVFIHLEGKSEGIRAFVKELSEKAPPLSHITRIVVSKGTVNGCTAFTIAPSRPESRKSALISPDVAVCDACLKELFTPGDRRYRYPFINCTHCGPRYTIIDDIPYDRPHTSMKHFVMCETCRAEYEDPEDRRFHAQPNACPACGPQVFLHDAKGRRMPSEDLIRDTVSLLKQGAIVAVKGLGGFHLAADAVLSDAVMRLRKQKRREEKPFAVMAKDLEHIAVFAVVRPEEAALLTSLQRPIVLLEKKQPNPLATAVSPENKYFGVMLPYTPLHHLLLENGFTALVMTSGNLSEEPIAIDNEEAFGRLEEIADYFLIHDRDIYLRSDDAIVRHTAGAVRMLRRSRGFVPRPVFLKIDAPPVLACGAELKSTVCLTKKNQAFLSQHIGDLDNPSTEAFFQQTVSHLERILDIRPEIVAHDLHPDYLSTRYALEARKTEKRMAVQHHHAHIVSCMAENRIQGPVIGLAFDGTGYGPDGTIWGGEILLADERAFQRMAFLEPVPLPGGEAAIREPWRMALSYLAAAFGPAFDFQKIPSLHPMDPKAMGIVVRMMQRGIQSPLTSSLGRLFDGVAALLGVRQQVRFEGQAAMALEMIADENTRETYACPWTPEIPIRIPTAPIIEGIVRDLMDKIPSHRISGKFHATVIEMFSRVCRTVAEETDIRRAALSGGVFQNAILLKGLVDALTRCGFEVYTHSQVPANDGGIALGQAVVAAATVKS